MRRYGPHVTGNAGQLGLFGENQLIVPTSAPGGLHVHTGSSARALALQLITMLEAHPLPDELSADTIVVHSRGMERWLKLEFGAKLGIAANINFPFPGRFMRDMFDSVLRSRTAETAATPSSSMSRVWEPRALRWVIASELLSSMANADPRYAKIHRYVLSERDVPGTNLVNVQMLEVADLLALLFDKYITYRPDLIAAWEKDAAGSDHPDEPWQRSLFRSVRARVTEPHLAAMAARFKEALTTASPDSLPERVFLFGLTTLPPFFIDLLHALATRVPVHLYTVAPAAAFDEESSQGFGAFAKPIREFVSLLSSPASIVHRKPHPPAPKNRRRKTALAILQAHLFYGARDPAPAAESDTSVELHGCHGAMRQVEVLRDALLHRFTEDPTLEPRHVLVMTPDLDTYAPLVDAVFSRPDPIPLPFRCADRSFHRDTYVADTLLKTLALEDTRFSRTAVLDLVQLDPVRTHFSLSVEDLSRVRDWVDAAGIRWGRDARDRARVGVHPNAPPDAIDTSSANAEAYTWEFGLDRLALGTAFRGTGLETFEGIAPLDLVEGADSTTLGRFMEATQRAFVVARAAEQAKTIDEWHAWANDVLETMCAPSEFSREHLEVRLRLATVASDAFAAGFNAPVSRHAFLEILETAFEDDTRPRNYLSGSITLSTLVPMRGVPFRVIALVGFDDRAFPRASIERDVDLTQHARLKGDRDPREEDRYMFLESVLSAEESLIVTYTARSERDDRERPPSTSVIELAEALRSLGLDEAARIRHHHLRAYSTGNFDETSDSRWKRPFDSMAARSALATTSERHAVPFFTSNTSPLESDLNITVEALAAFFKDPLAHMMSRTLGLRLQEDEARESDVEPFELRTLDEWSIGDDLLMKVVRFPAVDAAAIKSLLLATARVPPSILGDAKAEKIVDTVVSIHSRYLRSRVGPRSELLLDVPGSKWRVTGRIDPIFQDRHDDAVVRTHPRATYSKPDGGKHLLVHWIHHVAACAASLSDRAPAPLYTTVIGRGGTRSPTTVVTYAPVAEPKQILADLVDVFRLGSSKPIPFFPEASYAYATNSRRGHVKAVAEAENNFTLSYLNNPPFADANKPSTRLAFPEGLDVLRRDDFAQLATKIFEPLLLHKHVESDEDNY